MKVHRCIAPLAIFFLLVSISAFPQGAGYSDSRLIQVGPFGRPLQVQDEFSNWKIPISVYRDSEVEMFIPDITDAGWSAWNIEKFRRTGEYTVTVYSHFKNSDFCRREIIPAGRKNDSYIVKACTALRYQSRLFSVNTRNNTITVLRSILMGTDGRGDIESVSFQRTLLSHTSAAQPTLKAIGAISLIVKRQSRSFTGTSAQQAVQNNNKVVLKMMHDTMRPDATEGKTICDAPGIKWIGPKPDYCQEQTNGSNNSTSTQDDSSAAAASTPAQSGTTDNVPVTTPNETNTGQTSAKESENAPYVRPLTEEIISAVHKGQSSTVVQTILGPPVSVTLGAKHIYFYPNLKVVFVDGKVSEIIRSDPPHHDLHNDGTPTVQGTFPY
ncbi:MAG: hypothetical protein P4L50_16530 [Anaerolineaceae bacterium]|nr:hypothetical protein [Anaerolineaceae bacterium]